MAVSNASAVTLHPQSNYCQILLTFAELVAEPVADCLALAC